MVLKVDGMMCEHCKARVEDAIKGVSGVETFSVSLEQKTATVEGKADKEAVKAAITAAGYTVSE